MAIGQSKAVCVSVCNPEWHKSQLLHIQTCNPAWGFHTFPQTFPPPSLHQLSITAHRLLVYNNICSISLQNNVICRNVFIFQWLSVFCIVGIKSAPRPALVFIATSSLHQVHIFCRRFARTASRTKEKKVRREV